MGKGMGTHHIASRPIDAYTRIDPDDLPAKQRFFTYYIDHPYPDDHKFPVFESVGGGRVIRLDDPQPRHPYKIPTEKGWNYCLISDGGPGRTVD